MFRFWFIFAACFCFSCLQPAFAFEAASFQATVTGSYTLVANFGSLAYQHAGMQIQNEDAVALDCAASASASTPSLRLATGFTSVTLSDIQPRGSLYCKVASGAHVVTVNVWGIK